MPSRGTGLADTYGATMRAGGSRRHRATEDGATMTVEQFTELTTERLLLRQWRDADLDAWAAMNADPQVREFFDTVLTREQSAASMRRLRAALERRGWGFWALEITRTGEFIGFTGLDPVDEAQSF